MSMRKTFLALLLAASVTPALAQEKSFELKLSHWVPASHPLQKALEDWGASVQQAGADAAEHIVGRLAFQNDVVDSGCVQQLPQQQSRRPCANDCYFCPQYLPSRLR